MESWTCRWVERGSGNWGVERDEVRGKKKVERRSGARESKHVKTNGDFLLVCVHWCVYVCSYGRISRPSSHTVKILESRKTIKCCVCKSYTLSHSLSHALIYTSPHNHTLSLTRTHIHIPTQSHTPMDGDTRISTHTSLDGRTHIPTHTSPHTLPWMDRHIHICTKLTPATVLCVHSDMHTYTYIYTAHVSLTTVDSTNF